MFILRLKSKNTFFFMKYLRLKYDHIFIKKFNWKFWYQKLRKKILDLWNRSRESVYIYVSISKSQSIIDLENRRITSLIKNHKKINLTKAWFMNQFINRRNNYNNKWLIVFTYKFNKQVIVQSRKWKEMLLKWKISSYINNIRVLTYSFIFYTYIKY